MFYYSNQVRRFLNQIIAVLSHFEVEYGTDDDGNIRYYRVPVTYATTDKMVASILKNNSENTMNAVPAMSVYITALNYDRDRMQNPVHVEKTHLRQPRINQVSGEPTQRPGNSFTVEKLMPVPYLMEVNVDIWTSSTDQKLQMLEQLAVLFNPDFEIQSTDNYQDWASLSRMVLTNVNYSSTSVPSGGDDSIDVATMSFEVPIWISPPAKLKKLGVIERVVSNLYDAGGQLDEGIMESMERLGNRQYFTPTGYNLIVINGQATLYPGGGPLVDNGLNEVPSVNTDPIEWGPYLARMGQIKNGITQLRMRDDDNPTLNEVVGTISLHPSNPNVLLFQVDEDTVPGNTLPAVDAIIDPTRTGPDAGLPAPERGQRYLILDNINPGRVGDTSFDGADAWKNDLGEDFRAAQYDVIEYTGDTWITSWQAAQSDKIEYLTNVTTGLQYKWNGIEWVRSWEGEYLSGTWSVVI